MTARSADSETPPLTRGRHRKKEATLQTSEKHPRLRGEDGTPSLVGVSSLETPPLTRGRRTATAPTASRRGNTPAYAGKTSIKRRNAVFHVGNTPAYAGKTLRLQSLQLKNWKHPRLRGEDLEVAASRSPVLETPPLTRGRPELLRQDLPARGKHPRLRGEDSNILYEDKFHNTEYAVKCRP